jgi:hypothetical protein
VRRDLALRVHNVYFLSSNCTYTQLLDFTDVHCVSCFTSEAQLLVSTTPLHLLFVQGSTTPYKVNLSFWVNYLTCLITFNKPDIPPINRCRILVAP